MIPYIEHFYPLQKVTAPKIYQKYLYQYLERVLKASFSGIIIETGSLKNYFLGQS